MAERGDYRGIYTVLPEDPDFQDLGPDAQLVWFHLKLKLGPSGIDVLDAAEAVIAQRSGMPSERVADAMSILCRGGEKAWVIRERNVIWLRNGLRYEPSRNLDVPNHRKSVVAHLRSLPKLCVVNDFASAYGMGCPFPELGNGMPSPSLPDPKPITEDGVRSTEDGDGTPPDGGVARAREDSAAEDDVPEGTKPVKAKRRKVAMPEGWAPTDQHRERAKGLRLDCDTEAEKFKAYHAAKGSVWADWNHAFTTWLYNADDFNRSRRPSPGPLPVPRATPRGAFPEPERSTSEVPRGAA